MSTPNSTITFYDVFDLTNEYIHTRYFDDDNDRDDYFDRRKATAPTQGGQTLSVNPSQYTRIDDGFVKVPFPIQWVHGLSYMSIQNKISNKTSEHRYYCFITDCEYVSDMCTKVYFEVDVVQTFFHSMNNWYAYVERCHNDTDNIGDNIVAEPFNPKEYFVCDEYTEPWLQQMVLVVGVSTADDQIEIDPTGGGVPSFFLDAKPITYYNNAFTCIRYYKFNLANIEQDSVFLGFLKAMDGTKRMEIQDMFICPEMCVPNYTQTHEVMITANESTIQSIIVGFNADGSSTNNPSQYAKVSGHTPVNQKLFTYPFTKLCASDGEGNVKDYAFEFFDGFKEFAVEGNFLNEPSVTIFPIKYSRKTTLRDKMGETETCHYNYDNCLTLTNYPHCAFNVDAYQLYQSQNKGANAIKIIGGALIGAMVGYFTGGGSMIAQSQLLASQGFATGAQVASGAGALAGTISGAAIGSSRANINVLAEKIQARNSADITLGNSNGENVAISHNHKNFIFTRMCCNEDYAKQVDDYFTVYGYAQNKLMNIGDYLGNGKRPFYKYIKCSNFVVQGAIENKYKNILTNILNSGITFWYGTDTIIGNYAYDNRPNIN